MQCGRLCRGGREINQDDEGGVRLMVSDTPFRILPKLFVERLDEVVIRNLSVFLLKAECQKSSSPFQS